MTNGELDRMRVPDLPAGRQVTNYPLPIPRALGSRLRQGYVVAKQRQPLNYQLSKFGSSGNLAKPGDVGAVEKPLNGREPACRQAGFANCANTKTIEKAN